MPTPLLIEEITISNTLSDWFVLFLIVPVDGVMNELAPLIMVSKLDGRIHPTVVSHCLVLNRL